MFLNDWTDVEGLLKDFEIDSLGDNVKILIASYTYEDYNGDAFVLFEQDGLLYEVNGGHCSCYGLEDQWEPELTTVEAIRKRIDSEYFSSYHGGNLFKKILTKILDDYEASN